MPEESGKAILSRRADQALPGIDSEAIRPYLVIGFLERAIRNTLEAGEDAETLRGALEAAERNIPEPDQDVVEFARTVVGEWIEQDREAEEFAAFLDERL